MRIGPWRGVRPRIIPRRMHIVILVARSYGRRVCNVRVGPILRRIPVLGRPILVPVGVFVRSIEVLVGRIVVPVEILIRPIVVGVLVRPIVVVSIEIFVRPVRLPVGRRAVVHPLNGRRERVKAWPVALFGRAIALIGRPVALIGRTLRMVECRAVVRIDRMRGASWGGKPRNHRAARERNVRSSG